jgi:hypothetical protein
MLGARPARINRFSLTVPLVQLSSSKADFPPKLLFGNELRTATCRVFAPNSVNLFDPVTRFVLGIDKSRNLPGPRISQYLSH